MNKKLLIIVNFRLRNIEEFEKIKDKFLNEEYDIHIYSDIDNKNFNVEILYEILNKIGYENYENITVISNIRDVLFLWYRIYNNIINNFIFFIDKYNYKILEDRFYQSLANFDNIKEEKLEGKVYVNLKSWNYDILKEILMNPENFYYIDLIKNIELNELIIKKNRYNKKYIYMKKEYIFQLGYKEKEIIDLEKKNKSLEVKEVYEAMNDNPEIIPFYFVCSYKNSNSDIKKLNFIFVNYFNKIDNFAVERSNEIILKVIGVVESDLFDFKDGIDVLAFCSFYKEIKIDIGDRILEYISRDENYIETHYACIINLFSLEYTEKIKISNKFYLKMANTIKTIGEKYNIKIQNIKKIKEEKRKIAIIADQLMSVKHSTAKAILDYAINIKKYYKDYEVAIYVEDNFYNIKTENFMICNSYSGISSEIAQEHFEYMKNQEVNIPIYYFGMEESKKIRVEKMIEELEKYSPEIVFNINNGFSLAMETISKNYSSYYIYLGIINYQDNQIKNFYYAGFDEKNIEYNEKNIIMKTRALEFKPKEKIYTRAKFGLEKEDFVIVTVSLNPDLDFIENFIERVVSLLKENSTLKLLIIGTDENRVIKNKYSELINKQIFYIKYEFFLGALYQICDIYVNPDRNGGGYSVAEAMFYGLPVVTLKESRDASIWVGLDNCVNNDKEYREEIEKLYFDNEYYILKSNIMKKRIEDSNFKKHLEEIFSYVEE